MFGMSCSLLTGPPVFEDLYRNIRIKGDILIRETPLGLEHYRIINKE